MINRKAICLISDGLDSPIATFLLERKGIEVIGLNFDNSPLVVPVKGKKIKEIKKQPILHIAQTLVNSFKYQNTFVLYKIQNGKDLQRIMTNSGDPKITCILCKRLMLKKAEYLASTLDADLIATGEILGEQASQTIENLQTIESAVEKATLVRPNIGLNKDEIIDLARTIGTYQFSEISAKYTCGAVPNKPATRANLSRIEKAEQKLVLEESFQENIANAKEHIFYKNK